MKNLLLASTSTLHGEDYLAYLLETLEDFFKDIDTITFIPYARPGGISHDEYTALVAKAFGTIGKKVVGLHTYEDVAKGISDAKAFFTGGGNTFLLVKQLHELELMDVLKNKILAGTPYFGTSAGSNIAGINMQTTNDMPIVYPPSFKTLGLVPFNINAHYLDPDLKSNHNGETRETRIKEFHCFNTTPVVGLREGSFIHIKGKNSTLKGAFKARIFEQNKTPYEGINLHF
ncbi:dipeptidase PepE [Cellulophaga sp. L1A9]|uniref:dipeptidase PepE n=1 Tax=Cellulophaga sp. L1A9 TaxID=2686362 RepID=UPI00131C83F5|nr:dipeptidase PepE [Cellulophaga sp. L1A9]